MIFLKLKNNWWNIFKDIVNKKIVKQSQWKFLKGFIG